MKNIKLASRETKQRTIIEVGNLKIGEDFLLEAGPCSVENEEQMMITATAIAATAIPMADL